MRKKALLLIPLLVFAVALLFGGTAIGALADPNPESIVYYDNFYTDSSCKGQYEDHYGFLLGDFIFGKSDDCVWYAADGSIFLRGRLTSGSETKFVKDSTGDYYLRISIKDNGVSIIGADGRVNTPVTEGYAEKWYSVNGSSEMTQYVPEGNVLPSGTNMETAAAVVACEIYSGAGSLSYENAIATQYQVNLRLPTMGGFFAVKNIDPDNIQGTQGGQVLYYRELSDRLCQYGDRILGDFVSGSGTNDGTVTFAVQLTQNMAIVNDVNGAYTLKITFKDKDGVAMVDSAGVVTAKPGPYTIGTPSSKITAQLKVNNSWATVTLTNGSLSVEKRNIKIALDVTDVKNADNEDGADNVIDSTAEYPVPVKLLNGNITKVYGEAAYVSLPYTVLTGSTYKGFYDGDQLGSLSFTSTGNDAFAAVKYNGDSIVGYDILPGNYVITGVGGVDKTEYYKLDLSSYSTVKFVVTPKEIQAAGLNADKADIVRKFEYKASGDYEEDFAGCCELLSGVNGETLSLCYGITDYSRKLSFEEGALVGFLPVTQVGGKYVCEIFGEYSVFCTSISVIGADSAAVADGDKNYVVTFPEVNYDIEDAEHRPHSTITIGVKTLYLTEPSAIGVPEEYRTSVIEVPLDVRTKEYGVDYANGVEFTIIVDETPVTLKFLLADEEPVVDDNGRLKVGQTYALKVVSDEEWALSPYHDIYQIELHGSFVLNVAKRNLVFSRDYGTEFTMEYGDTATRWNVDVDNGLGGKETFVIGIAADSSLVAVGQQVEMLVFDNNDHENFRLVGMSEGEIMQGDKLDVPLTISRRELVIKPCFKNSTSTDVTVNSSGDYVLEYGEEQEIDNKLYYYDNTSGVPVLTPFEGYDVKARCYYGAQSNGYPVQQNVGRYEVVYVIYGTDSGNYYIGENSPDAETAVMATAMVSIIKRPVAVEFIFAAGKSSKAFYDTYELSEIGSPTIVGYDGRSTGILSQYASVVRLKTSCGGLVWNAAVGVYPVNFELDGTTNNYTNYEIKATYLYGDNSKTATVNGLTVRVRTTAEMNKNPNAPAKPNVGTVNSTSITLNPPTGLKTEFAVEYGYGTSADASTFRWASSRSISNLVQGKRYYFAVRYAATSNQNEASGASEITEQVLKIDDPTFKNTSSETTDSTITVFFNSRQTKSGVSYSFSGTAKAGNNNYSSVGGSDGESLVFNELPGGVSYNITLTCTSSDGASSSATLNSVWTLNAAPDMTVSSNYTVTSGTLKFNNISADDQYEYRMIAKDASEEEQELFFSDDTNWQVYTTDIADLDSEKSYIVEVRIKANSSGAYNNGDKAGMITRFEITTANIHAMGNNVGFMAFVASYMLLGLIILSAILLIIGIMSFTAQVKVK